MLDKFITSLIFFSLIMLSFLVLSNPMKVNKKANTWFGIYIFLWASFWLDEIITLTGGFDIKVTDILFINFIQFLTPAVFYISILFFTNPNYKFSKKNLWITILPIVYLTVLILQQFTPFNYQPILLGLLLIHSISLCIISFVKLRKHKKNIKLFSSNPDDYNLSWLEHILMVFIFIVVIITLFNIIFYKHPLNLYMNIAMLLSAYFIAYNALKQKEIYPINKEQTDQVISISEQKEDEEINEDKRKIVSDEKLVVLKAQLNTLMQNEEPYLNSELNLINLSELLDISPHILSYVINTGFGVNFPQFVNKYRVEKAKLLLKDKDTAKRLSILGIAFESGFNSKTVFNTTFKKITGQTPSEYKKNSSNS